MGREMAVVYLNTGEEHGHGGKRHGHGHGGKMAVYLNAGRSMVMEAGLPAPEP